MTVEREGMSVCEDEAQGNTFKSDEMRITECTTVFTSSE